MLKKTSFGVLFAAFILGLLIAEISFKLTAMGYSGSDTRVDGSPSLFGTPAFVGQIKIGIIGPMGLPHFSPAGMKEGAEMARDEINAAGGIHLTDGDYELVIVFGDEHAYPTPDPTAAALEVERLITVEGCEFVIGGFRSEVTGAMIEMAMDYDTPFFINGAFTDELIAQTVPIDYERYKYLLRVNPVNETILFKTLTDAISDYLLPKKLLPLYGRDLGGPNPQVKVAVLMEDLKWTEQMLSYLTNPAIYPSVLGPYANVTYAGRIPDGSMDCTPWLQDVKDSEARLLIHVFSGITGVPFIMQWSAMNVKALPVGINLMAQLESNWQTTGGACEYESIVNLFGTRTPIVPGKTEVFWDNFVARTGVWPMYTAFGAYDGINMLVEALEAVGTKDKDALVAYFEDPAYERIGLTGKFKFDSTHDLYCSETNPYWTEGYTRAMMVQWQSERMEVVSPIDQPYTERWVIPPMWPESGTELAVDPANATTDLYSTFEVNIAIANVTDLHAYEFRVYYNNTILEGLDVYLPEDHFLAGGESGNVSIVSEIHQEEGYVRVNVTLIDDGLGRNGSGILTTIRFNGTDIGEGTLRIEDALLLDTHGIPIPYASVLGNIIVVRYIFLTVHTNGVLSDSPVNVTLNGENVGMASDDHPLEVSSPPTILFTSITISIQNTRVWSINPNSRHLFTEWTGPGTGTNTSNPITITLYENSSCTANYKTQHLTDITFKDNNGTTSLNPKQAELLAPNGSLVTLFSFSNLWLDNGTWTVKRVLWQGNNVKPSIDPSYVCISNGTWNINCRVYSINFTHSFKDSKGTALYVKSSSFRLTFPNGTTSAPLTGEDYFIQNGTTTWHSIIWQDTEVLPTPVPTFDATNGNPIVYCEIYSITVDPIFYDNTGTMLIRPPSWYIRFPNGTVRAVSSPVTYNQTQAGTYSVVYIMWEGSHVFPDTIPTTLLTSDKLWSPSINCILPTSISISLSSSTSYIGFKVEMNGNLTCNDVGVSGAPILLSYSVTKGASWSDITLVNTGSDGSYLVVWMPSATGNYIVRGVWAGNATYPETTATVNLAVTIFEEQNVFSVESNSAISELAFNTTNWQLSFTATGPNGTEGYVKVTVAKSLIENITNIRVYLDGNPFEYSITSTDDSWLLTFNYMHSTHQVVVDLDINIIPEFPSFLILPLFMLATLLAVIVYKRKHQTRNKKREV